MQRLTVSQWYERQDEWVESVLNTPGIAHYCSGPDWGRAAATTLHEESDTLILNEDDHWVILSKHQHSELGLIAHPLEAAWGFTSPFQGSDTHCNIQLLQDGLKFPEWEWNAACLSGLSEDMANKLSDALEPTHRVVIHPGIAFQRASLNNGLDGYCSRRSSRFRKNISEAQDAVRNAGIHYSFVEPTLEDMQSIWARLLMVETASWKWANGESVLQNQSYFAFYQILLQLASARRALHVGFAQLGEKDVAYIVGGVLGTEYRGFQMSFDNRLRSLGLGNAMQMAMIEHLSSRSVATYDLGMDIQYKSRWSDEKIQLQTAFVFRS